MEDSQENERKTNRQGRNTNPANERVADAGHLSIAREGLPSMEMSQELPLLGSSVPFARATGWVPGVGRLPMRAHMDNNYEPEVLAVVPRLNLSVASAYPRV